jgi:hypothetical protein
VVHEVGYARHRANLDGQLLEDLRARARRRVKRGGTAAVDVVEKPHCDPSPRGGAQLVGDDRAGRVGKPDVVKGKLQGPPRGSQEVGDPARDVVGLLAAVAESEDLDMANS